MIVDSHCHLNFEQLSSQLDAVLERAKTHDIGLMQTICTKMSEFEEIKGIAAQYPHIYCSVGVHPNNVSEEPLVEVETLVEATKHPKVIGIGETGYDFYYEHAPRDLQKESFVRHIEASRITQLPIIIHTRSADDETIAILQQEMAKGAFPGLIHCFSTSHKLAEAAVELGMYVSISGIVTFKKAVELQESVKKLPLERLLVETDAPYLAPVPYRGKTNEPAFTAYTVQKIAELKEKDPSEVAEVTTNNFLTLFKKAQQA